MVVQRYGVFLMFSKFEIEDEVVVISPPDGAVSKVGLIGVVTNIDYEYKLILVAFNGDGFEDVWWCEPESLEIVPPVPISLENV